MSEHIPLPEDEQEVIHKCTAIVSRPVGTTLYSWELAKLYRHLPLPLQIKMLSVQYRGYMKIVCVNYAMQLIRRCSQKISQSVTAKIFNIFIPRTVDFYTSHHTTDTQYSHAYNLYAAPQSDPTIHSTTEPMSFTLEHEIIWLRNNLQEDSPIEWLLLCGIYEYGSAHDATLLEQAKIFYQKAFNIMAKISAESNVPVTIFQ